MRRGNIRILAILSYGLCCSHLNAAIARTGSGGGSASFTFSATATGDLKIVFSYRAATTPPSLPAGWTTITTLATSAGGTTGSIRVGCNVSSSSGDTGSGTWTQASQTVGISYSGTAAKNTAACNTGGIGNWATNQAKTSTTVNFPAIIFGDQTGTSWLATFAGDSAVVPGDPTGQTQVTSAGSAPGVSAKDSNGTVSSWSSQNVTVTSSTWLTAVVEIRAPSSATPSVIQYVHGSNTLGQQFTTGGAYKITFPQATQAGNAIVGVFTYSNGSSLAMTMTTDTSDTCSTVFNTQNGTASQGILFFYCGGIAGGAKAISINNSVGSPFQSGGSIYEVKNLASASAFDGGLLGEGTSGSPASGSFTTGGDGDWILSYVTRTTPNSATAWTAGSGFALTAADLDDGVAEQTKIQSSAGAINPGFTMTPGGSGTDIWVSAAAAFKPGPGGAYPAASLYITSVQHYSWPSLSNGSHTKQFSPVTGSGRLLVGAISSGGTPLSSVSDSHSNTWAKCGTTQGGTNVNPTSEIWYAANATTSPDMTFTFTVPTSSDNNATFYLYDVTGAATSSVCGSGPQGSTGTQSVAGNLTAPPSLTPDATGSIIIVQENHFFNTAVSITNTNCIFGAITYHGESLDGPQNVDQNQGLANCVSPSTSAMSFVWTFSSGAEALSTWAASAAEFKAAPASTRKPTMTTMGIGDPQRP